MKYLKLLVAVIGIVVFSSVSAVSKKFELHQAVIDKDISLVTRLLSKGAEINELGSRFFGNGSALHLAVREGYADIAKLLLDRGAEVDVLDPFDVTPLHNAAWNGNIDLFKLLLDAGADIEASTYDGNTPLSLAQNNNQPKVAELIQAKIQAPSATRTKVESPVIADSRVIDISGTYIAETTADGVGQAISVMRIFKKMNGKLIVLKQTGNTITGSDSSQSNWIKGTREGNIINFYGFYIGGWTIDGSWEINADATNLEGKWNTDDGGGASGKWNLTKIDADAASVPDISGTYISEITSDRRYAYFNSKSNRSLVITIKQDGNNISATDKSNFINIVGTKVGDTIEFYFIASSQMGTHSGTQIDGVWKVNADASRFEGKWKSSIGGASGKWNLTKIE